MRFLALALLVGCGTSNKVKVSGEATVNHKITVDFSVCDALPEEDRTECIKVLLEVLKEEKKRQEESL